MCNLSMFRFHMCFLQLIYLPHDSFFQSYEEYRWSREMYMIFLSLFVGYRDGQRWTLILYAFLSYRDHVKCFNKNVIRMLNGYRCRIGFGLRKGFPLDRKTIRTPTMYLVESMGSEWVRCWAWKPMWCSWLLICGLPTRSSQHLFACRNAAFLERFFSFQCRPEHEYYKRLSEGLMRNRLRMRWTMNSSHANVEKVTETFMNVYSFDKSGCPCMRMCMFLSISGIFSRICLSSCLERKKCQSICLTQFIPRILFKEPNQTDGGWEN